MALQLLQSLYLAYLSKPVADRAIYRLLRRSHYQRLVEIGVGDGKRSARMIALARGRLPAGATVSYTGIDLFESRPADQPGISLKALYRQLAPLGAQVRLYPGDIHSALSQLANHLGNTDLLIIRPGQSDEALRRAWTFIPRMLHASSIVLVPQDHRDANAWYRPLALSQLPHLRPARAAA